MDRREGKGGREKDKECMVREEYWERKRTKEDQMVQYNRDKHQ